MSKPVVRLRPTGCIAHLDSLHYSLTSSSDPHDPLIPEPPFSLLVPQKELSATIREFISRHVRSVEQLEILLMFQKDPDTSLTVPQVYDAILSTPQSVQRWLDDLTRSGLLQRSSDTDAGYRCCPDADIRSQISNLAEFYRTTPVRVIEAIYKRETSAAQSFADAFKITKDDTTP